MRHSGGLQRKLGSLAALLPLVAFGVFMASSTAEAGLMLIGYCYYAGEQYSPGACLDQDCCFWCISDNQRCNLDNGGAGYWGDCGGC